MMKNFAFLIVISSCFSVLSTAGSVLDDFFNLVSLGKYHQEYTEARERMLRDLAHEESVLQGKLNEVSAETDLFLLNILGMQYALAKNNYEQAIAFRNSQMVIVKMIEDINLDHLRSNNDINLSLDVARDLKDTYQYLTNIQNVRFDSKYIDNVQNVWWESFSKIAEIAKRNQNNTDDFVKNALMNLDKDSIESLYKSLLEFQNDVTSKMVSNYRGRMNLFARRYNGQLKTVKAYGKGLELQEIVITGGGK